LQLGCQTHQTPIATGFRVDLEVQVRKHSLCNAVMTVNFAPISQRSRQIARDRTALKQVFQTLHAHSCPKHYNFHMHTVYSDGRLSPERVIEQAVEIGLEGLAITDHHSVGGYYAAQRWLDELDGDSLPTLWTGIEINAKLLTSEVHILGYAFDPDSPLMHPYLQGRTTRAENYQAANVIAAIQAAGGLAVLAHPERYRRSASDLIPEAARLGIDGAEAYYAYGNPHPWQPSPKQTKRVLHLNQEYGLLSTCGTDTHGSNIRRRL
jgi:predicted metal-dependent phosphoesterase TrpH